MNLNDETGPDGFEPDEVDSLLDAAFQGLLDRVRAEVDPAASLAEIMSSARQTPRDRPDDRAVHREPGAGSWEAPHVDETDETVDPDLTFVLCFGEVLGRAIDTVLDLAAVLAADPGAGHALALARALFGNMILARDFEPSDASADQLDFALDLTTSADLDADFEGDLDNADRLDWARIVAQARFLDFARVFALSLIRILESEPGSALDLARQLAGLLATAGDIGLRRAMTRNVEGIRYINAAGRDLSWLDALDTPAPVPVGTVWDEETILPPTQAAEVEAHSVKIGWGRRRLQAV